MNFITEFHRRRHEHKTRDQIALESLCVLEQILVTCREILATLKPRITGLEVVDSGDNMTKTVQAIWDKGTATEFHGFDANHPQPADWPSAIQISDTAGEVTNNNDGTFTVTGPNADTINVVYDSFTATFDYTAPAPVLDGIEVV